MATKSIVQPLTGKHLPPRSPTWPITMGRLSYRVFLLPLVVYGGVRVAAEKGIKVPFEGLALEAGVAVVAVICLPLAVLAIYGAVLYPPARWKAIFSGSLGFLLIGGFAAASVPSFLAERARVAENDDAKAALESGLAAAMKGEMSQLERGKKVATTLHALSEKTNGERKAVFETVATGLDSINAALAVFEKSQSAFQASGAVSLAGIDGKGVLAARRKLLSEVTSATQALLAQLQRIDDIWITGIPSDMDRDALRKQFVKDPQEAATRALAIAKLTDEVLASLEESKARWAIKKSDLVFKKKLDEKTYQDRRSLLEKTIAGVVDVKVAEASATASGATAAGTAPVPGAETIGETEAREYAMSYIALVQRNQLDEAYKYLPPDVRALVTAKQHEEHWRKVGGSKLASISVDASTEVGKAVGFRVQVPGKEPEIVVVVKAGGNVYSTPQAFLPK